MYASHDPKTIRVLAVPFAPNKMLFYPLPTTPDDYDLSPGRIHKYLRGKYDSYAQAEPGTWRYKIYSYAKGKVDDQEPVETYLQRLPSTMTQLEILFPSSLAPEGVIASLRQAVQPTASSGLFKVVLFAALLPCCVIIDVLTFGFLLTLGDATMLALSWSSWRGAKRSISASEDPKRIHLTKSPLLDQFLHRNAQQGGYATDNDISTLAAALNLGPLQPYFEASVKQVRDRELRLARVQINPQPWNANANANANPNANPNANMNANANMFAKQPNANSNMYYGGSGGGGGAFGVSPRAAPVSPSTGRQPLMGGAYPGSFSARAAAVGY